MRRRSGQASGREKEIDMFGDIHPIAPNTLFIEGLDPRLILREPDVASVILHKAGDTLYLLDTGATRFFRERIKQAAERLRPFARLVLLNSHGHPDHTPNNAVVREIEADHKAHFIAQAALSNLDYAERTRRDFAGIAEYYHLEDGPGFPFSLLMKPLKLFRLVWPALIERHFLSAMIRGIMRKFEPLEPSPETATPLETLQAETIRLGGVNFNGWKFGGDVWVIETRGHTPDSVSFFLPRMKVLFLADETVDYFNCWADSSAARVTAALEAALALYKAGEISVLIGGHQTDVFRGEAISALLRRLLGQQDAIMRALQEILAVHPRGLTVKSIYRRLKKYRRTPATDRFFQYEFPKMPGMLKTEIVYALLEAGYKADGKHGRKRFYAQAAGQPAPPGN